MYKVYVDVHGGFPERGHQMRVGLLTMAIFSTIAGYVLLNVRD